MPIKSLLKSTVVALAIVSGGSLFAQGTPINAAAFDALVAKGPVADAATIAASPWASKIKQAGTLRLGGTQTSNLFSLLNEKDGRMRGFDAGLAQLITRYILGDAAKVQFTQVNSSSCGGSTTTSRSRSERSWPASSKPGLSASSTSTTPDSLSGTRSWRAWIDSVSSSVFRGAS